jgi:hypothetical protein
VYEKQEYIDQVLVTVQCVEREAMTPDGRPALAEQCNLPDGD